MRLLTFDSGGELSLTEYFAENIPPYAILSHAWGADDDEVTFADLINGSGKSKAGYAKILFCGEQARKDGLQYFWMDTCCIDNANLTELSEAMTSMFRWYRDAAMCYVYLSDVSTRSDDNNQTERTWESDFRKSRWFTLCWTLQDLLAPESVKFFSREGVLLGDKSTLEQQIHKITGIPIAALRGTPLSLFSIDERMRWAANRHARREEDKAYSLLGIFNVFMPLIYGEGENAIIRLRREIEIAKNADEVASVNSVNSLRSIATGSSTTLIGEMLAAADEFVILLLEDQAPLLSTAFDRIETDRLERNITRLLKLYAFDLRKEARDDIEKEAVQLIRLRARYIAYRIRQCYDKSASGNTDGFGRLSDLGSGKRALLESYISGKTNQNWETSLSEPYVDGDNDRDASDSDTSSEAESDHPEPSDLDRVKIFMLDSAAYHKFRQNLRDFILPRRAPEPQDSTSPNLSSFVTLDVWRRLQAKGVEVLNGLRMLSRPLVPPDHKRITWICVRQIL